MASSVISTALEKNINIQIFKFDSGCDDGVVLEKRGDSVGDSVYSRVSADTGGAYHSLPVSEIQDMFANASFELRSLAGTKIMSLPLSPGSGEYGSPRAESFFGTFRLPQQDALVYAIGTDASGAPFQQVMTAVVSPVYSNATYRLGTLDAYAQPDITLVQLNGTVNLTSTTPTGFSISFHSTTASASIEAAISTSTKTCPQNTLHRGDDGAPWKDWAGAPRVAGPRGGPGCRPGGLQSWPLYGRPNAF